MKMPYNFAKLRYSGKPTVQQHSRPNLVFYAELIWSSGQNIQLCVHTQIRHSDIGSA